LNVYGGKGKVGHRLYIGGGGDKRKDGILRDRIESDHLSVVAWMRREREGRMEKKGE